VLQGVTEGSEMSFKKRKYRRTVSNLEVEQFLKVAHNVWFCHWRDYTSLEKNLKRAKAEADILWDCYNSILAEEIIGTLYFVLRFRYDAHCIKCRRADGFNDEELPMRLLPTNDDVRNIFNEVYNKWFTKYRDVDLKTAEEWDQILAEGKAIHDKYPFTLTEDLVAALYAELDRRNREKGENNGQ
jgi:hypothetical protein